MHPEPVPSFGEFWKTLKLLISGRLGCKTSQKVLYICNPFLAEIDAGH